MPQKEHQRRWYLLNRERCIERQRKWREKNRESHREYSRSWHWNQNVPNWDPVFETDPIWFDGPDYSGYSADETFGSGAHVQ
jgi:hypothetical protein